MIREIYSTAKITDAELLLLIIRIFFFAAVAPYGGKFCKYTLNSFMDYILQAKTDKRQLRAQLSITDALLFTEVRITSI